MNFIDVVIGLIIIILTNAVIDYIRKKIVDYKENKIYRVYINDSFVKECPLREGRLIYECSDYKASKGLGIDRKNKVIDISIDKY